MTVIINAELVMRDHLIPDAALFIEDGKITGWGEMRSTKIPENCEVIDAKGLYVAPGFVDIHSHASDGVRYQNDPLPSVTNALRHGTTTLLPTISYQYSKEEYITFIDRLKAFAKTPEGKNIGGIYMEGPYTNPKFGSNKDEISFSDGVYAEDYMPLIEHCGDAVHVWTVAPEREGILDFVKAAKKANPAVRFSVGHSEASPQQIEALMPYGLCIGTHHTNATGDRPKYPECRGVCVDEAVNYHREIYAEVISDKRGIHVDPYMQRLIRRIKGDEKVILITDATGKDGCPTPPGYEDADDIFFDCTGEIQGTNLTSDGACRNWMKHTGAGIVEAFRAASYNPATAVGFTDRGEIAVGKRADLVIVDHHINVKTVIFDGKVRK